jgi:hypothetical protein
MPEGIASCNYSAAETLGEQTAGKENARRKYSKSLRKSTRKSWYFGGFFTPKVLKAVRSFSSGNSLSSRGRGAG